MSALEELSQRLSGLLRLDLGGDRGRDLIPFVPQTAGTDCGPACLAMVLAYHGKAVSFEDLRRQLGTNRDGVAASELLALGRRLGLRARSLRVEPEDLECLSPGAILHWGFSHFVVLERARSSGIRIVDPAVGRRFVPRQQVGEMLTGVVLSFEPTEELTVTAPAAGRVAGYVRTILRERSLWTSILVASLVLNVLGLLLPLSSGAIIDAVVPRSDRALLTVLAAALALVFAMNLVTAAVRGRLFVHLTTKLDVTLTCSFLEHLTRLPYAFFQLRSRGDILARITSNTTVREIITGSVLATLLDGPLVVLQLGFLLFANPLMGGVALVLGALLCLVRVLYRRRQAEATAHALAEQARLSAYQIDMLSGMETLKAMGLEGESLEGWSHLYVDWQNASIVRSRLTAACDAIIGTMHLAWPFLILGIGALQVIDGRMTLGHMLALQGVAAALLGRMASLVRSAGQMQYLRVYLHRLDDILQSEPEQAGGEGAEPPEMTGAIVLEDLSFRYSPHGADALCSLSLRIQPGEFVGVVGRSGSGKSTLAKTIMGLYRPTRGRVLYDGRDLAGLDLRAVRRQIGFVPQTPHLFGGTIRANIAICDPGRELPAIAEAARRACVHDEVVAMPLGYETPVSDGGSSLSGGQRQRVALARALLRDPAILVLDEASSALDAETERRVQSSLAALRCTRVVIAHRLSTVVAADRIVVLDEGRIVEEGDHVSLLARDGHYAALVRGQIHRPDQGQGAELG